MKWLLALLACAGAASLSARDLPVPADKGWQHARTGLILMPVIAGLRRTALTDTTKDEFDVAAQYHALDDTLTATIYLFHPAIADVPLWFDRARAALEASDRFKDAAPATADPIAFATTDGGSISALKQAYALAGGAVRSTEVAIIPQGDWLVAVRMSATSLTAEQLDARLGDMIAGIRWPATPATAPVAVPIKACATPLSFGKAKQVKTGGADVSVALLGNLAATNAAKKAKTASPRPRTVWCRDRADGARYGVYRSDRAEAGYVMALGDAGRVVRVSPALVDRGTWTVSFEDVSGDTAAYPSFSAMPAPDQVWASLGGAAPSGTSDGKNLTINPDAF